MIKYDVSNNLIKSKVLIVSFLDSLYSFILMQILIQDFSF